MLNKKPSCIYSSCALKERSEENLTMLDKTEKIAKILEDKVIKAKN